MFNDFKMKNRPETLLQEILLCLEEKQAANFTASDLAVLEEKQAGNFTASDYFDNTALFRCLKRKSHY